MLTFKPEVGRQINAALAHMVQLDNLLRFTDKHPFLRDNLLGQIFYLHSYGGILGDGSIDLSACTVELFGGLDYFFDVTFTFKGQTEPMMVGGLVFHGPRIIDPNNPGIDDNTSWSINT